MGQEGREKEGKGVRGGKKGRSEVGKEGEGEKREGRRAKDWGWRGRDGGEVGCMERIHNAGVGSFGLSVSAMADSRRFCGGCGGGYFVGLHTSH